MMLRVCASREKEILRNSLSLGDGSWFSIAPSSEGDGSRLTRPRQDTHRFLELVTGMRPSTSASRPWLDAIHVTPTLNFGIDAGPPIVAA